MTIISPTQIMLVECCPKCTKEVVDNKSLPCTTRTFQHIFKCTHCNIQWVEHYKLNDDGTVCPSYLWGDGIV